jgi:hypothetical protein
VQSKTLQIENIVSNNTLAGHESDGWHPLVEDFILVGQKLEQLGFIYHKGRIVLVEDCYEWRGYSN